MNLNIGKFLTNVALDVLLGRDVVDSDQWRVPDVVEDVGQDLRPFLPEQM